MTGIFEWQVARACIYSPCLSKYYRVPEWNDASLIRHRGGKEGSEDGADYGHAYDWRPHDEIQHAFHPRSVPTAGELLPMLRAGEGPRVVPSAAECFLRREPEVGPRDVVRIQRQRLERELSSSSRASTRQQGKGLRGGSTAEERAQKENDDQSEGAKSK